MANQYGPACIFLGSVFLFYGIINFFIVIWHQNKYRVVTATISACREYRLKVRSDRNVCFAVVLDFMVDQKSYKVRQDIAIEEWAYSKKNKPYAIDKQITIYYNRKKPNDVDLDSRKFYRNSRILSKVFFIIGLIVLLIGIGNVSD